MPSSEFKHFNILPVQSFSTARAQLTQKDAQVLYELWQKSEDDGNGRRVVPSDISKSDLFVLSAKGYINKIKTTDAILGAYDDVVEFTRRGKETIKRIILGSEESTFDKNKQVKVASTQQERPRGLETSWVIRLLDF